MITSQRIIHDSPQSDGRRYITYEYTDPYTVHIIGPILVSSNFDADADLLGRIPGIEQGLSESEEESFEGDPLTFSFKYTNKKKAIRSLLIRAMNDPNPKRLLKLKPVIEWIRANYTGAQVANYLNITPARVGRLAARFDALVLIESTLNSDGDESWQ